MSKKNFSNSLETNTEKMKSGIASLIPQKPLEIKQGQKEKQKQKEGGKKNKMTKTYNLFLDDIEFMKDLVFYKATKEGDIKYNEQKAIAEAIEGLREKYPSVKPRPEKAR